MEINKLVYGVCNLSVVPLRAAPSDKSEMVSQLLFGDLFEILEKQEKWVKIKTEFDAYECWLDSKQYVIINETEYLSIKETAQVLPLKIVHTVKKLPDGQALFLVAGSSIPVLNDGVFSMGGEMYQYSESLEKTEINQFSLEVITHAKFYLNAPYLWGGRTLFGIDCSGFTQMVFKQFGIKLFRDAWQQAEQGVLVSFLPEAQAGDLAFFDNDEGKIIHVGIMINPSQIIHASGKVRIDAIDDQGIYNAELGRYSHRLRIIRRFVN